MDLGCSLDTDSRSTDNEIPLLLWNLKVYYYVYKSLSLVPILSQWNVLQTISLRTVLILFFHLRLGLPSCLLSLMHVICPALPIRNTPIIFHKEYKLRNSSPFVIIFTSNLTLCCIITETAKWWMVRIRLGPGSQIFLPTTTSRLAPRPTHPVVPWYRRP